LHHVENWFRTEKAPDWKPIVLENDRLDLAVARGAAYYGMVRRGQGVKITANLARSYYLGVANASGGISAVCVIPGNAEPGQEFTLSDISFMLVVSEPVEFPLYVSSIRLTDTPGTAIPVDSEQMTFLPPIRTAIRTRKKEDQGLIPVHVHGKLTEIGTLELWCSEVHGERSWKLQFDIRSSTQTDIIATQAVGNEAGLLDETQWQVAWQELQQTFIVEGTAIPETLPKRLADALQMERHAWPPSLLRRMWEALIDLDAGRKKSAVHEARWLNLLGYCLRPGYGMAVDDWRVTETWRTVSGKLAHSAATSRTESLILWRRIGGGLSSGQQKAVGEPILSQLRTFHKRYTSSGKAGSDNLSPHEANELMRLLGSLELLPLKMKHELGNMLNELVTKKKLESMRNAMFWTLGRIGARVPLYGPLNTVVPVDVVQRWLINLISLATTETSTLTFAIAQMARRTQDRYRDISSELREQVVHYLLTQNAPEHTVTLVRNGGELSNDETNAFFGESLPQGLRISHLMN
jgi:DNA-K related protein